MRATAGRPPSRTEAEPRRIVTIQAYSKWSQTRLWAQTEILDTYGFSCYWLGDRMLTQITGCYHEVYDQVFAGAGCRVACVRRDDPWFDALGPFNRGGLCEAWLPSPSPGRSNSGVG